MRDSSANWLARWGPDGEVWRARDRLARTLTELPRAHQPAFAQVLPELDAQLNVALPRLRAEARFLTRYLARQDRAEAKAEVRRWQREAGRAGDPELRAVRQRNLDLAKSHLTRLDHLAAAVQRYDDQRRGLVLAIDEVAGRLAASLLDGSERPEPELDRLRQDVNDLAATLAALNAELAEPGAGA